MEAISLWFSTMYNALLRASGLSPEDKIEERIPFALFHARLCLTVSSDDWDDKSDAAKIYIYPVVVEDIDIHYKPSLSLYWLLPM